MFFLLFHLARSYYNPPEDEVSCGNEVGCGEGRLKRRLRRIFKSLRLRRKVDTKEGIVVTDVIKEKKSETKFSKFIKFFKRKSGVKEERKSNEDPPTCSTFSPQLQIVKSNINVANQSSTKQMLYFVFGKCFGLFSSLHYVVIGSAVQSFENIDKVSSMETEIEIKDDSNEMETCDDNTKDAIKNQSKIDNIASPTGITMELNIPVHITTCSDDNTDSEKDAKWKSTEDTHVDSGPGYCENLSERILKLDVKIPGHENESADFNISDDSNDADYTLDEIKADDEKGSKADDDDTVPL